MAGVGDMFWAGRLLVATPVIGDPNFERTVVFLLEHGEEGALGLVVNRPTDVWVGGSLPQWEPFAPSPSVVFVGGPVEQRTAIALARPGPGVRLDAPDAARDEVWSPVLTTADSVGPLATLDLEADPALATDLEVVRIYVGYAGWEAGQLESEMADEAWRCVAARPSDLWSDEPEGLWSRVLRRQGGTDAWLSLYPPDPSGN